MKHLHLECAINFKSHFFHSVYPDMRHLNAKCKQVLTQGHLPLYLTVLCEGAAGAATAALLARIQVGKLGQIRLTGHSDPGDIGVRAQLPQLDLSPLLLGMGRGSCWVGGGAGRDMARGVVRKEEVQNLPLLRMSRGVLVLWRESGRVTLSLPHHLHRDRHCTCDSYRTGLNLERFLRSYGKKFWLLSNIYNACLRYF